MLDPVKDLLTTERRGRALALLHRPLPGDVWRVDAEPDADGCALMAAARWAERLGAAVELRLPEIGRGDKAWSILAQSGRLQGQLRIDAPVDNRLTIERSDDTESITAIPDADAAWKMTLDQSSPMLSLVDHRSPHMTCAECREVDRRAIDKYGVPGVCLMENAAVAAVTVAGTLLPAHPGARVTIVAGGGNNGGDGLAMARGFRTLGITSEVALLKPATGFAGDAADNYSLLTEYNDITVHHMHASPEKLGELFSKTDLIVDGLLGTGFRGMPSPDFHRAIEIINSCGKRILSLDIPSGLNGDTGRAEAVAVKADACITFAAVKIGLVSNDGPAYCGTLYLGDIGAPNGSYGAT